MEWSWKAIAAEPSVLQIRVVKLETRGVSECVVVVCGLAFVVMDTAAAKNEVKESIPRDTLVAEPVWVVSRSRLEGSCQKQTDHTCPPHPRCRSTMEIRSIH